mmetsp:Transcript_11751/g.37336  ORF Transcript_11751/g.37336 Transcript_11751/m.37336 type:complete len:223 (+) Transcript_11751:696-1364(+)
MVPWRSRVGAIRPPICFRKSLSMSFMSSSWASVSPPTFSVPLRAMLSKSHSPMSSSARKASAFSLAALASLLMPPSDRLFPVTKGCLSASAAEMRSLGCSRTIFLTRSHPAPLFLSSTAKPSWMSRPARTCVFRHRSRLYPQDLRSRLNWMRPLSVRRAGKANCMTMIPRLYMSNLSGLSRFHTKGESSAASQSAPGTTVLVCMMNCSGAAKRGSSTNSLGA